MADIFLSYASEDRERVRPLVAALETGGFSVWWDRDIRPGQSFDRDIENAIAEAKCLVVAWSQHSVESDWVRNEVEEAVRREMLVPVLLDDVLPPLAYRRMQAVDLRALTPGARSPEFEHLLTGVAAVISGDAARNDPPKAAVAMAVVSPRLPRRGLTLALAGLLCVGVLGVLAFFGLGSEPMAPRPVAQFRVEVPEHLLFPVGVRQPLAISADGGRIVFNVRGGDGSRLYSRALGELGAQPIRGTEGARGVVLSPDGEWAAFYSARDASLKKVRLTGGEPVIISSALRGFYAASWSTAGFIVFDSGAYDGLMKVSAAGGVPERLTFPEEGEVHRRPFLLPDGSAVLFGLTTGDDYAGRIAVFSIDTGEQRELLDGAVPQLTRSGHLLFYRYDDGLVWAAPFDVDSLEVTGDGAPVLEGVRLMLPRSIYPAFSVAGDGSLAYIAANSGEPQSLVWVNRNGREEKLAFVPEPTRRKPSLAFAYGTPMMSPDGGRAAMIIDGDVWVFSLERETATRLTTHEAMDFQPIWSPDGRRIVFASKRRGPFDLYAKSADGTGEVEPVLIAEHDQLPSSWSADGQRLFFTQIDARRQHRMGELPLARAAPPKLILDGHAAIEMRPALSPDGRWLAYESSESGLHEVYVRPYPNIDEGRWQISAGGGSVPRWGPEGRELFYWQLGGSMMVASVTTEDGFSAGEPKALFDVRPYLTLGPNYAVSPDGERFLMVKAPKEDQIILVQNWLDELERLVPVD